MSTATACKIYSLSLSNLYVLMGAGKIRYTKIGKRRLVEVKSLDELFEANAA